MIVNINKGSNSAAGKGCATLFFSVFAVMGLVFTVFMLKAGFDTVRTYFWDKTDCTIQTSSVREDGGSFKLDISYSYRAGGRWFTGTRLSAGMQPGMNGEDAQRVSQRYAPGSGATCHYNPSSPQDSVLERGSLWFLFFLLIPLVFVAVGVGGIIGVWRVKAAAATPVSERHRKGPSTTIGLRVFALFFIAMGGGFLFAFFVRPALKAREAAGWPAVPCEILSSRVQSHSSSKGGLTYSVEIRYRYHFAGRDYTGTRYNSDTGSSSSRSWRAEVAKKFPPKLKTICHVNPSDPIEAVLSTSGSPDRWFGLIPGVFLVVGLFIFFKAPAMAGKKSGSPIATVAGVPVVTTAASSGPAELKPASTPLAGFIFIVIFALIWNGIVWGILLGMREGEVAGRVFVSIFALVGVGLIALVGFQFLALFNPRPVLTASAQAVPLGGTLDVQWRFTGSVRRLARLRITFEGREEATYRRGTTTTTDKSVFANLPLIETTDRAQMSGGSARLTIPRDLIHTFTAPNNKIIWTLRVAGDIPKWPDVSAEFPIAVLPRSAATLYQEQNPAT